MATVFGISSVAALAYLMFNLYTPPCFAAIGAMNSEIMNKKWLWAGVGLQFATGYTVAFLLYQLGTALTTGNPGSGFVPGLIAVLIMAAIIVSIAINTNRKFESEYNLHELESEGLA